MMDSSIVMIGTSVKTKFCIRLMLCYSIVTDRASRWGVEGEADSGREERRGITCTCSNVCLMYL